jgi:hypothetical protein
MMSEWYLRDFTVYNVGFQVSMVSHLGRVLYLSVKEFLINR